MKKLLIILISVALAVLSFAACDQNDSMDLGFLENSASSNINGSSSETEEDSSSSETEESSSSSEEEEDPLPPIGEDIEEDDTEEEDSGEEGAGEEGSDAFWSPFL